jgi:hypothetical protein
MNDKELLKKARSGVDNIDDFFESLQTLNEETVSAAIGAIAVMKKLVSEKKFAEVVWLIIEYLSDTDDPNFLRLLRMKQMLFPHSRSRYISITPEIFTELQKEAKALLVALPDATDDKRMYWKSIIKGKVPPGIIIKDI